MPRRRKLIVVSNRGPISYGREEGERVASRGAGGLVTALAPLVSHHDVTWIASAISDEDRRRRGGTSRRPRARLALPAPARRARARRVRPLLQRRREPGALVRPARALGARSEIPSAISRPPGTGLRRGQPGFADAVVEELEREPEAAVFFHDYHLYVAPGFVRARRPEARWRTSRTSPGSGRTTGRCCRSDRRARSTRGCSPATSPASTRSAGASAFLELCRALGLDPDERARHGAPDLDRPGRVRVPRRREGRCSSASASSSRAGRSS